MTSLNPARRPSEPSPPPPTHDHLLIYVGVAGTCPGAGLRVLGAVGEGVFQELPHVVVGQAVVDVAAVAPV